MKDVSKRSWLVWAIVILAVMNLSTILTIIIIPYKAGRVDKVTVKPIQQMDSDAETFSGRYFHDRLGFDIDQKKKFREINPVFRHQAQAINLELSDMRIQMLNEMVEEKSDTNKLNALSDSIGNLHGTLKKITYQYYLDIKSICNKEQQKELELLFSETFTKEIPTGKGNRWRYRGQNGKRNDN